MDDKAVVCLGPSKNINSAMMSTLCFQQWHIVSWTLDCGQYNKEATKAAEWKTYIWVAFYFEL